MENDKNVNNSELEELKKSINTLKGKLTTLESEKKELEKEANELIGSTIYQKKEEIERSYNEVLKEAEVRLKVAEKEKAEEKKKNLARVIEQNTRSVKENNVYLKNEIKRILEEKKLPGFVNSSFYMSVWNPLTLTEKIGAILAAVIVFLIPTIISFVIYKEKLIAAFPNNILRYIVIVLIYLAVIFIVGFVWLLVERLTKKDLDALKEIREIRKNISDNIKEIEKISKETSKEMTDDKFDYTKLDRDIEAGKIEVEKYKEKKKEAMEHFVNVTQAEIERRVGADARAGIEAINNEIEKVKLELTQTQNKHDELKLKLVEEG